MANPDYLELLRDPRWQKKRLEIFRRDDWKCRGCRDTKTNLQVHHKRYERGKKPWEYEDRMLVTLCSPCHERITVLMKRATELLSELNLYELPIAVTMLEKFWTDDAPDPLQAMLARLDAERNQILGREFTPELSRRLEAIDELADKTWGYLQARA